MFKILKMMKKILIIALCLMATTVYNLSSQTFYGEIRQRGEYRNGYKMPADSASEYSAFVSQRTRLGVGFNLKNVEMRITLQDVRAWGDQKLKTNKATTGIYEAWALLPISDSFAVKLGRQELIYDNERILSNNNWNQAGQVHDAAVLKYKHKGLKVDFGLAYNSQEEALYGNDYSESFIGGYLAGNYKAMGFLYAEKTLSDKVKLAITSVADAFQKLNTSNTNYVRSTFGATAIYKPLKNTYFELRGYYQTGKTNQANEINSWYVNPEAKIKVIDKFSINPGAEIISGNDRNTLSKGNFNAFSTLYGTGHNFNGFMDYFTDMPKHTKNAGLIDIYLKNSYQLTEKTNIKLDYHYFKIQNEFVHYTIPSTTIYKNSYLGSEIDFNVNFAFSKEVNLMLGYSMFLSEEPLNLILGGEAGKASHWGVAMLTIKPKFSATK